MGRSVSGGSTTSVRPIARAPWTHIDSGAPSALTTQLVSTCGHGSGGPSRCDGRQ